MAATETKPSYATTKMLIIQLIIIQLKLIPSRVCSHDVTVMTAMLEQRNGRHFGGVKYSFGD